MIGIIYTYVIYIYLQTSRSCSSRRSPSQRKPASRIKRRLAIRAADAPAISSNKACRYDPQVSHAVSRARNNTVLLRHRAACQQCPRGSSGRGSRNACKRQANAHTHTHTHTHTHFIYIYIYIYIYMTDVLTRPVASEVGFRNEAGDQKTQRLLRYARCFRAFSV